MELNLVLKSNFEVIECNFDDLEAKLREKIQNDYNLVVTEDTVKEAKVTKAEINKGKKALEQIWREKKNELEAPIKALNDRAKQVFALCDDAVKSIDAQIVQFEAKKRELAVALCEEYKNKLCSERGIPFESVQCGSLNNLGYVTEKGLLSSQGKQVVENLVNAKALEIQEQKQRELEKQLEVERIKQEAVNNYKQQVAQQQPQPQVENTQQPQPQPQQTQIEVPKEQGKTIYRADITLCVSVAGEYNDDVAVKVKDFFVGEITKNPKLNQALQNIEVSKA